MNIPITLRDVTPDEFDSVFEFVQYAFHEAAEEAAREAEAWVWEADRTIGVFDGDRQVGNAGIFTRDITVPGGPIPVACVTAVAVAATHTRRGILTRMMRHQLNQLHDEGREPVAALWASESVIYGRFGYGSAGSHARLKTSIREVRLKHPVPPAERRIRLSPVTDTKARAEIAAVYERFRTTTVGHTNRNEGWWNYRLRDGSPPRLTIALHDGDDGPDGYVIYDIREHTDLTGPQYELKVQEFVAETPQAHDALWSFLFGVDLVSTITWRVSPSDAPLRYLVDHRSRVTVDIGHNLWVRLVDVDRALAARRYAAPVDVVFEVTDELCPWNAGRWRLVGGPDGARCEATDDPADLALSSTELGAAYLGGTTLASMASVGLVRELRPGALRAASVAFAEPRPPYCQEVF